MEKGPRFEMNENPEQKLVRLLRERGVEDPEAKKLLDDWTREQEARVEQLTGDDYLVAQIQLNLKRARLYAAAGYTAESLENFEDARTQAFYEQRDELYEDIMKEMDEMGL